MFELVVGNARAALTQPAGDTVREALERRFGPDLGLDRSDEPYVSEDIGMNGWFCLQEKAQSVIPADQLSHLLWRQTSPYTVYLPLTIAPTEIDVSIPDESRTGFLQSVLARFRSKVAAPEPHSRGIYIMNWRCASLPALVKELEQIGQVLQLPTDDCGLQELWERCSNDPRADEDELRALESYAQAMLAARQGIARGQPLWLVK